MYYILVNQLSNNGTSADALKTLEEYFNTKNIKHTSLNLIEVSCNVKEFIDNLTNDDDVVIVGGDGTLHRFANEIRNYEIPCQMYLYKAGTGNDFSREFKKQKLINITKHITNLPTMIIDGHEELFLNGTGIGVDGEVCALVNNMQSSKRGLNYFKNALKTFKSFKRYDLEVTVDGVRHTFKSVWLATVMNGKYFGGGMKLSPNSDRGDNVLELFVIHTLGFWKLLCVFPLIFLGKHLWFKYLGISILKGREFIFEANAPQVLQSDGEVLNGIKNFIIKK